MWSTVLSKCISVLYNYCRVLNLNESHLIVVFIELTKWPSLIGSHILSVHCSSIFRHLWACFRRSNLWITWGLCIWASVLLPVWNLTKSNDMLSISHRLTMNRWILLVGKTYFHISTIVKVVFSIFHRAFSTWRYIVGYAWMRFYIEVF